MSLEYFQKMNQKNLKDKNLKEVGNLINNSAVILCEQLQFLFQILF